MGEGDSDGGVVVTAGDTEIVAFGLECDGVGDVVGGFVSATVGVMTGCARNGEAELADAADADCWATCALTTPCVVIRSWLPLTSRPTRSTAVSVTAVITTQESSHPRARVSGRPGPRRPPSLVNQKRPRGDSLGLESRRGGSNWSGSCSSDTSSFSAVSGASGVKAPSRWCGNLGTVGACSLRY